MSKNRLDAIPATEKGRVLLLEVLRRGEREATASRVAATLSHSLGTPLNVIAGRAAMIGMDGMSIDEIRSNARIIEQQVRSIAGTLRRVLSFARNAKGELADSDARGIMLQAVHALEPLAETRRVALKLADGPAISTRVQVEALLLTLTNLISLGVESEPSGGAVELELRVEHTDPPPRERGRVLAGQYLRFLVSYASTELPVALLESAYEPWLAVECADRDAALALAMSYGIARENRGWVDGEIGSGTSAFVVNWPLAALA
jgi:two-component system, NtrC family, sensor kinase